MTDWEARATDLLYEGEEIRDAVDVDGCGLVVTSHRLLAFTPRPDGANFHQVDRPNVQKLVVEHYGTSTYLRWAVRPAVLGVVLLFGGATVSLDGAISSVDSSGAGAAVGGGIFQMVDQLATLLALVDDLMLVGGALCLLGVAALLGLYARSRTRVLRVVVAGDENVELPTGSDVTEALERVQGALTA